MSRRAPRPGRSSSPILNRLERASTARKRACAALHAPAGWAETGLVEHAHDDLAQFVLALLITRGDGLDQQVQALLGVTRIQGVEGRLELRIVGQPQLRGQTLGGEGPRDVIQGLQRALAVAGGGAQARVGHGGVEAAGLELQRAAKIRFAALGHQRFGLGGHDAVQEALDLGRRERADELVDDLAVLERLHGGDRLDAEGLGEALVGVGVDLDERDLAVAVVDGLLDHGADHAAGAAPLGPEVTTTGCSYEAWMTSRSKVSSVASMGTLRG